MSSLAGHRVLVTGGSMGIGRAVAEALAAAGAELVIAARGTDAIDETVAALGGEPHVGIALDVSSPSDWERAAELVEARGGLDGLVAAAGTLGPIGAIDEISVSEFQRTIEINLLGTMLGLNRCMPLLAVRGGAAVTFSGGGGTSPLARYDAYAASKAAVVRLTENVAVAARERGVRINCVSPGFVATRMHQETLAAGAASVGQDYYERTQRELEGGGIPASVAAELVCFLLSDEAAGITGKLISGPWDPWREESFRTRLREDRDLATLRRIDEQFYMRSVRE